VDNLQAHIQSQEGRLEHLMRKLPGFAGYKDREERRQADQMQRTHIADSLAQERGRLGDVASQWMQSGSIQGLSAIDRLQSLLDRVTDRIRHAAQGYGAFFDAVRIDEAALDRVYEFDLGLLNDVASIGEAITALAHAVQVHEGIPERLAAVESQIKAVDQKLDSRTRVMQGVQQ
jgi:hypothetical protein